MKKCANCGTENKDVSGFCGACGNPLVGNMQQEPYTANAYQIQPDANNMPPAQGDQNAPGMGVPPAQGYQNGPGMGGPPVQGYQNAPGMGVPPAQGYQNGPGMGVPPAQGYQNAPGMGVPPTQGYQNPGYNQPYPNAAYGAPGMGGSMPGMSFVNQCIRQAGSSTLFLVACILSTVGLVAGVLFSGFIASGIAGFVPGVLFIIGIWIFYNACRNNSNSLTTGITLMKASVIVSIVGMFLLVFIVSILLLVINAALSSLMGGDEIAIIIAFVIAFLLIMIVPIVCYFLVLKALNSIKKSIQTNTVVLKGVTFLTVILYVAGILGIIGSLSNITAIGAIEAGAYEMAYMMSDALGIGVDQVVSSLSVSWLTVISGLLSSTGYLLFGIVLSKAKKALKSGGNY